jgi:signal transduction histidine kinase
MIKEKAIKHQLTVSASLDRLPDTVKADERKMKQIMYNLLSNAVKFTPDGGEIQLIGEKVNGKDILSHAQNNFIRQQDFGFKRNRDWIKISVKDTGVGISEACLDLIFNPFEQGEKCSDQKYEGTGLGLSLTKNLVELHSGYIWAESEGTGKGSTFHFVIPVDSSEVIKKFREDCGGRSIN